MVWVWVAVDCTHVKWSGGESLVGLAACSAHLGTRWRRPANDHDYDHDRPTDGRTDDLTGVVRCSCLFVCLVGWLVGWLAGLVGWLHGLMDRSPWLAVVLCLCFFSRLRHALVRRLVFGAGVRVRAHSRLQACVCRHHDDDPVRSNGSPAAARTGR